MKSIRSILIITITYVLCYLNALTQSISPFIVSSSGNDIISTTFQLSYTVCEMAAVSTISNNSIITQGFQQPDIAQPNIVLDKEKGSDYKMYPNPTSDYVIIESNNCFLDNKNNDIEIYELYDLSGKLIRSNVLKIKTVITLTDVNKGLYLIKIINQNTLKTNTYKLILN